MKTGEILSMVSLPDFDPNHMMASTDEARFHQAAKGVFEMGSIFKILNTAIALETGAVVPEDTIDVRKPMRIGRFTINDYHPLQQGPEYFRNFSSFLKYWFSTNGGTCRTRNPESLHGQA